MTRDFAAISLIALLAAVSLPLLVLRALRLRGHVLPPAPTAPHQFAFGQAIPAYEALIDSTATSRPWNP